MADLNTVNEELSNDAASPDRNNTKGRGSIRRASIILGGTGVSGTGGNARNRRQSSWASGPRGSLDRRFIRYENTFRMEPVDDRKVDLVRLRRIATTVIETAIAGYKYDSTQGKQFSLALADLIRSQIKQLPFDRYKIIVQVSIGQKKGQDLRIASRCLWDDKWDRHLTITKETADAYVTVTIFFVYTE